MAVAWESTLQELVEEVDTDEVMAICRVTPGSEAGIRWSFCDVVELWAIGEAKLIDEHGPLLFGLKGANGLVNAHGTPVNVSDEHRRRLFAIH